MKGASAKDCVKEVGCYSLCDEEDCLQEESDCEKELFGQESHEKVTFTLILLHFKGYVLPYLPSPTTVPATQPPY